jgi:hypothetical protein
MTARSGQEPIPRGALEPEKRGPISEAGSPEPSAPEVESARLLANEARERLRAEGFSDDRIRQLADEFVARDLGEDVDEFVAWAREQGPDELG